MTQVLVEETRTCGMSWLRIVDCKKFRRVKLTFVNICFLPLQNSPLLVIAALVIAALVIAALVIAAMGKTATKTLPLHC